MSMSVRKIAIVLGLLGLVVLLADVGRPPTVVAQAPKAEFKLKLMGINRTLDGVNIASLEIANCLLEHPDVAEAATLGVKDDIYGEVPVGFVALRPGRSASGEVLLAHCRAKLVTFKVPAAVLVVDAIPKNANGKIDRPALTALWEARTP